MAKGVDVENYPGMPRENGGKIIAVMKSQARGFNTEIRDDVVLSLDTTKQPFEILTNTSGIIRAHTVILATGANSRYLHAEGEWELHGNGVSSCATCDGYLFKGKTCAVVGGGDTAMEEALFLSRICSETTIIHRRDTFRASAVMQKRVLDNTKIKVLWNTTIAKYVPTTITVDGLERQVLSSVMLQNTNAVSDALTDFPVDAVFVAIGHDPNTNIVKGQLEMDNTGYLVPAGRSTSTSVPGIFAAGDVADHTYRQAITSAGSGAMAALDAERYLSEHLVEDDQCVQQDDFSTWTVKELRAQMKMLGITCAGCTEKSDFIDSLRATY
jgi:thioredoxin reductase